MAAEKNIQAVRGDTRRHAFTIKARGGPAIDISSWTGFKMAVSKVSSPPGDGSDYLVGEVVGSLTSGGTDGRVHFSPPGTWAAGKYFYDAQAIDSNGEKITFVRGSYELLQDRAKG